MSTVTINILKKSVMGVVEGLSASIAQHNPDVDFSAIWASDAEEPKLDIYYREAITDLESQLSKWTSSTSTQFDLQALADDLQLTIKNLANWPSRFSGLLSNQIQNYLVHAIMAGWLNDFPEIKTTDYVSVGAADLESIKEILLKKEFSFVESDRATDATTKEDKGIFDRCKRSIDAENKYYTQNGSSNRLIDADGKDSSITNVCARNIESLLKDANSDFSSMSGREKDDSRQCFRHTHVDWSGGIPPFILR